MYVCVYIYIYINIYIYVYIYIFFIFLYIYRHTHFWENNSLAERASLLLLNEVCLVNINAHIFCISSNFIILALSKSKYTISLNNGLSAACGEML